LNIRWGYAASCLLADSPPQIGSLTSREEIILPFVTDTFAISLSRQRPFRDGVKQSHIALFVHWTVAQRFILPISGENRLRNGKTSDVLPSCFKDSGGVMMLQSGMSRSQPVPQYDIGFHLN
jgi:hypothetical protein